MYFGGPIYDTFEKFMEYYAHTKKMKKEFVPEDVALKGVSLANLHNVVVLRDTGEVYTLKPYCLIDREMIDEIIKWSENEGEDLRELLPQSSIIQYVCYPDPQEEEVQAGDRSSHAGCIKTIDGELVLLDGSEPEPLFLTGQNENAAQWLEDIEYISVFEVITIKPSPAVINKLSNAWERIY